MKYAHAMPFGAELRDGGVDFRIWAPSKNAGRVVVDGTEYALERREDGWFAAHVSRAGAGTRYAYVFPGLDTPIADPASRFQPEGVHAPSEVVDPAAYAWQTPWRGRPWHEIVVYELHVGTFSPEGTYRGAAAKLDALAELGITAIELMPLAQPAGTRNWGYDGVLPFAPQHAYGSPEDLKALIDAAHARGLCVYLDVVYNHFGPEGNYLPAIAAEIFTDRHHTPWGAAINYDGAGSRTVRELVVQNALYWLREYRFDGLRFDAVHEIRDDSPTHVLHEIAARVRAGVEHDRHVHLVLENDKNEASRLDVYDAQWNDDAHHAFHVLITGERDGYYRDYADAPAKHLARALAEGFAYQGEPSTHRGGAPRGEPSSALPATAFVDFLQNHDQIGNRAFGDRIDALAAPEALRVATALLLLAPSIPLLFMGEEWDASTPFLFFSDFGAELAQAVTEGRRKEFAAWPAFADPATRENIPDPQDPATMEASRLRWDERERSPHAEALEQVRELLALRARAIVPHLASDALGDGWELLDERTICVRWRFGDGARLVLDARFAGEDSAIAWMLDGEEIYAYGDFGG
ncbi:MAG TPA: malto-oligosyltrehalose trehalohydrolase [Candidatus Baltobacteraceae bacterium]|nr:malto-oligosyltrehalose trehalohydrolase [Candidatus Baltobacteraceae bacterium]